MRVFLLSILLGCLGCSCTTPAALDSQSAVEGNDLTAILSGCGQQLAGSGYLVCRQPEGKATSQEMIVVHTPPNLNCEETACTFVKVFFPDGRPALEIAIPKGKSFSEISWKDLLGKDLFDITDRGFYAVSVTTHFLHEGQILKTYAEGMIFMHVVKRAYMSLIESKDDENFRWIWQTPRNQSIKLTSGYRVYIGANE